MPVGRVTKPLSTAMLSQRFLCWGLGCEAVSVSHRQHWFIFCDRKITYEPNFFFSLLNETGSVSLHLAIVLDPALHRQTVGLANNLKTHKRTWTATQRFPEARVFQGWVQKKEMQQFLLLWTQSWHIF